MLLLLEGEAVMEGLTIFLLLGLSVFLQVFPPFLEAAKEECIFDVCPPKAVALANTFPQILHT